MRQAANALRGLVVAIVRWIDIEGALVLIGSAFLAHGLGQFNAAYTTIVWGGALILLGIFGARPAKAP